MACPRCGGGGGGGSRPKTSGKSNWSMGREYTGTTSVSMGSSGATHVTPMGKTTVHRDGKLHHHKLHSTNPRKGNFVDSDKPHGGVSGKIFGSLSAIFGKRA